MRPPCQYTDATRAFARGELSGEQSPSVEEHLTACESCRAAYRDETGKRFPQFPSYTVVAELGRGGFGTVYKALHHAKGRYEALKVLFAETTIREAYFENEVRLVAQLRHPNIATLFDAQLGDSPMYYTMEYVAGQRLDAYVQSEHVTLEERIRLIRAVAEAVEYAHAHGVVHRDLKPQNILVDAEHQPRIIDFGIGKRLGLSDQRTGADDGPRSSPGGILGTYGYIAPEQAAGQHVDTRVDIFALGALLFHVVTGEPAKFARQHQHARSVLRQRGISRADDLAAIIARCTSPAPELRYASARALIDDLDRFAETRAVLARPDAPATDQVARLAAYVLKRHPLGVAVAAVASIAVLLSVGATLLGAKRYAMSPLKDRPEVVLIAFTATTLDAIRDGSLAAEIPGLSATDFRSWRLAYGRLLERLAVARPRVVSFDIFFPECRPEYDPALIAGIRAAGVPVLFAVRDIDVNAEPALCPALREAAWGWGAVLAAPPNRSAAEIIAPAVAVRGLNAPFPSLALSTMAAVRFPDSTPEVRVLDQDLSVRYQLRAPRPGAARWRSETDLLRAFDVRPFERPAPGLVEGDVAYEIRLPLGDVRGWERHVVSFEDVLHADEARLRAVFGGRVVLVARWLPGQDQYALADGSTVYGSQVLASMIDGLLGRLQIERRDRFAILVRVCAWCVVGALLALLAPATQRRRAGLTIVALLTAVLVIAPLALWIAARYPSTLLFETLIAVAALVAALGVCWIVRILNRRFSALTPAPLWPTADTGDVTTVVAPGSKAPRR